MSLPDLSGVASAAGTRRLLEADGWRHLATGDWSWVYASPDGAHVARVAPWDPAYLLSVEVARRLAANPYVPRVAEVASLAGVGHVVSLERLQPADATQAAALCVALDLPPWHNPSPDWWTTPPGGLERDPDVIALRDALREASRRAEADLPFWGGSDVRPRNVLAAPDGQLTVVDALGLRGPAIAAAIATGDLGALERLPNGALEAFITIPPFEDGTDESRALQAKAREIAARLR